MTLPKRKTWNFNPRPREGGDIKIVEPEAPGIISIHAPARGATVHFGHVVAAVLFQSTPPRGGRRYVETVVDDYFEISIHAPARGATSMQVGDAYTKEISIHAPARGATAKMHSFTCGSLTNK